MNSVLIDMTVEISQILLNLSSLFCAYHSALVVLGHIFFG